MNAMRHATPIDTFSAFHAWFAPFVDALGAAAPVGGPDAVRADIVARIDGLAEQGGEGGPADNARELRYLMAAFADEILIARGWPQPGQWIDWLVEEKMFRSRHAGDRVFERIDTLLRGGEAQRREMALPYLFALALGFQGTAAGGAERQQWMQGTRRALFLLAQERAPDPAFGAAPDALDPNVARRVMARPYQTIASAGLPVLLPSPHRWRTGFVLALLLLLAGSCAIWQVRTSALRAHFNMAPPAAEAVVASTPQGRP